MKRFTNTISNHDLSQAIEIYENIKIQMNEISFPQGLTRTPSIKARRFAQLGPFCPLDPLGPLGQKTQEEKSASCCTVI